MDSSQNRTASIAWFLILAALLHVPLLKLTLKSLSPADRVAAADKKKDVPIEIAPNPEAEKKPVVQTSKAKEQEEAKDKEARFAGEFRNRVKEEMRSPNAGAFREAGPEAESSPSLEMPQSPDGDFDSSPRLADLLPNFSSSPNALDKSLPEGRETVLNTDGVRFASFINRIADEIYEPWASNARAAVRLLHQHGRTLDENVYVTRLSIRMDKHGEVTAIQILRGSGVDELDEAPKRAFWDKEPFPNPPAQLVQADGQLSFTYEFQFELKTSSFSIVPQAI